MQEDRYSASSEDMASNFPRYSAAALGFRNYWYPVMFARDLRRKPKAVTVLGERIVLVRDRGRVYALHDRCPHRGVPLSEGRCEFPGHDLPAPTTAGPTTWQTGKLVAALTDGPDSPICGKASVAYRYPVEERGRAVWVYVGDGPPRPSRRTSRRAAAAGHRRGGRQPAAARQLALRRRERHRRGPRQVPAPQRALGLLSQAARLDGHPHGAQRRRRVADARARRRRLRRRLPAAGALAAEATLLAASAGAAPCAWASACPAAARGSQRGWTGYELYVPSDENHYSRPAGHRRATGLAGSAVPAGIGLGPLALPRPVQRPGPVDDRADEHPAGAALPPRRLHHGLAKALRGADARRAADARPPASRARAARATRPPRSRGGGRRCAWW